MSLTRTIRPATVPFDDQAFSRSTGLLHLSLLLAWVISPDTALVSDGAGVHLPPLDTKLSPFAGLDDFLYHPPRPDLMRQLSSLRYVPTSILSIDFADLNKQHDGASPEESPEPFKPFHRSQTQDDTLDFSISLPAWSILPLSC